MTTIALGVSHYVRSVMRSPQILLINMMVEKAPDNPVDGLVRFGRPGLAPFATVGAGPIRGVFRQPGTFNGDWLVVSGNALYRVTKAGAVSAALGTIAGAALVTIAATATRALIATGGACYSTYGAAVTQVAMPGGESVSSVAQKDGYFILPVPNSDQYFWIQPGGTNPDALDFANVENSADNIERVVRLFDELWFFGEATTEVWQSTGNADAPWQRIAGRLYEKGCAHGGSVAVTDNTLFWVGDDLTVYRGDAQPVRISDHAIEEALRLHGTDDLRAWTFALDGHTCYVLRIGDGGTYVYDVENPNWYLWKTYARDVWRAHLGAQADGTIIAGDDVTGDLWRLDATRANDNGDALIREIMGGLPWAGAKPAICANVSIFVAAGWAPIVGSGSDPVIELDWSDDGVTFHGPPMPLSIGTQGQYGLEVVARQLGAIYAPGRLWKLRMADDTLFRVSWMKMNES